MHPDEFGQSGSVKLPLTPAISNIFHAPSKTMETSSHLVEPLIPTQLVMVFEILIWNSTVALSGRLLVSKEGILAPRRGRGACAISLTYLTISSWSKGIHDLTPPPSFHLSLNQPVTNHWGSHFKDPTSWEDRVFPLHALVGRMSTLAGGEMNFEKCILPRNRYCFSSLVLHCISSSEIFS